MKAVANQIIGENEYLRYICDNVIKTEIVNSIKDQEIVEKAHIKEKLANERSTTESNVFQDDEVNLKSKGLHKRQKTHINILTCGNGSVDTSVEGFVSSETMRNSIKSSTEDEKVIKNIIFTLSALFILKIFFLQICLFYNFYLYILDE